MITGDFSLLAKNWIISLTGWWFQPIWKILYNQNGNLPPNRGENKNVWNHHLAQYVFNINSQKHLFWNHHLHQVLHNSKSASMFQKTRVCRYRFFLVPFSQLPGWILSERHCETSKACRIAGVFLKPLYLWDLCVKNLDLRPENAWKKFQKYYPKWWWCLRLKWWFTIPCDPNPSKIT